MPGFSGLYKNPRPKEVKTEVRERRKNRDFYPILFQTLIKSKYKALILK